MNAPGVPMIASSPNQRRFRQLQDEKANGVDRQNVNNSSRILGQKHTYR